MHLILQLLHNCLGVFVYYFTDLFMYLYDLNTIWEYLHCVFIVFDFVCTAIQTKLIF